MEQFKQIFNVYCDESRVENPDSSKMVIGALIIPRSMKFKILEGIKNIKEKYGFVYELKWTKTNTRFGDFYKKLIDYFISQPEIRFRCIVVDKKKINYSQYHNDDPELAFFKFYYLMLRPKLLDYKDYFIFIDRKPTRDRNRARALHSYLESYILWYKQECSIKHLQAYSSEQNLLLQIADYFTGLVGYASNVKMSKDIKSEIVNYFEEKLGRKICEGSPLSEEKFNYFLWRGDEKKR